MMLKPFGCEIVGGKGALALLALRIVPGVAFALHGWGKVQNASAWAGEGMPSVIQFLVAYGEFLGGIAILVGFLTPLAALGLVIIMAGAVNFHISKGDPFVSQTGGWELAGVYLSIMVALFLRGAGSISVDGIICKKKS